MLKSLDSSKMGMDWITARATWDWEIRVYIIESINMFACFLYQILFKKKKKAYLQLKHQVDTVASRQYTAAKWGFSTLYWNSPACKRDTWKRMSMLVKEKKKVMLQIKLHKVASTVTHSYKIIAQMRLLLACFKAEMWIKSNKKLTVPNICKALNLIQF